MEKDDVKQDEGSTLSQAQKDTIVPELADIFKQLKEVQSKQSKDAIDREEMVRLGKRMEELAADMTKNQRRGEFSEGDADMDRAAKDGKFANKTIDYITKQITKDPEILEVQEVLDRTLILSELTGKAPRELQYFRDNVKGNKLLSKAIDLASIANWQPTVFSSRIIERVRLALTVAGLHPRINMPADPYKFPIEGNDPTMYRVAENGEPDADLNTSYRVPNALTPMGATNLSLSSVKLGGRIVVSNETDEDAFLPVLDILENKIIFSMAEAQDNVTVNGSADGNLDSGSVAGSTDQRTAWDGYREFLDVTTTGRVAAGGAALTIQHLRSIRQQMGKYAIFPKDFVWVVGPVAYIKMLGIGDTGNPSPVLTVDKYGPNASIKTGELGSLDGSPIIVTEFMGPAVGRENFNLLGRYDGTSTAYTEVLAIRPSAWLFGDRRQPTLKTREIIETDQQVMVLLQRLTLKCLYAGQPVVGGVVGITK